MSQYILLYENKNFYQCLLKLKCNVKKLFLIKSVKFDMSNYSEFHKNNESISRSLFYES